MRNCNSNISQLSCHLFNHQSFAFLKIKNTIPNWNKLSFFGCFVLVFLMEKKNHICIVSLYVSCPVLTVLMSWAPKRWPSLAHLSVHAMFAHTMSCQR